MSTTNDWLDSAWPLVRRVLPGPPARVVEIGCGSDGGFVPFLLASGYDATGVDPAAPEGTQYRCVQFEDFEPRERFDAAVASLSLHHVADPAAVLRRLADVLQHGSAIVVLEWAWELFDERTARWCAARLGDDRDQRWLGRHIARWTESGREWDAYLQGWAADHGLHRGDTLVERLDERFERHSTTRGPYFFPDLMDTTEADEQAAIDRGQISATRIEWFGRAR